MEQKQRTILRLLWSSIRDNLEPKDILPKLVTVLIETDKEDIKAQSTRQERCDKLLEILLRRGPTAFEVFVEALKQTVPHLAVDLIEADKKTEDELIDPRKQSARLIAGICKLKTELETEKQNRIRTLQGLKKMKTLHGKGNETKEEEITPDGLQKKEATTESLTQKEQDETRQKENFKEDDERLLQKRDYLDEENKQEKQSKNLEEAKEEQEKIKQLQRENKQLKEKVREKTFGFEKILAREQQMKKKLKDSLEKCQAQTKDKDVLLEKMRLENKRLPEQSNAEKSKCDALSEEVRRLKEISGRVQKEHIEEKLNSIRLRSAKIQREISDLKEELDAEEQNIETLERVKSDIVARHSNTRDLTEITLERDELRKQCESLAKHLEEAQLVVRNLKQKLTTTFQERATSPRDLEEFERTEGRTEHDRCDATEHSEKLRGEIHQLKTELEAEKQDHIKTSQELEELKRRHEIQTLELADLVQQLRDVRHYAERENQSWEKEIQEWKTKSEKYEQENQALQKSLGSAMKNQERLEVLSSNLEIANKAQREQIRQLQRMNEELQDKVTNERVLKTPVEIVQQHTERLGSEDCQMDEKHRSILRDLRLNIMKDLEPKCILPHLGRIFTETQEEEIRAQSTREERCVKLLEILPRKGAFAFAAFVDALDKEAYHLALELMKAEKEHTEEELSDARTQSAKIRRGIYKLKTELDAENY